MYCSNCGSTINIGDQFCRACGTNLCSIRTANYNTVNYGVSETIIDSINITKKEKEKRISLSEFIISAVITILPLFLSFAVTSFFPQLHKAIFIIFFLLLFTGITAYLIFCLVTRKKQLSEKGERRKTIYICSLWAMLSIFLFLLSLLYHGVFEKGDTDWEFTLPALVLVLPVGAGVVFLIKKRFIRITGHVKRRVAILAYVLTYIIGSVLSVFGVINYINSYLPYYDTIGSVYEGYYSSLYEKGNIYNSNSGWYSIEDGKVIDYIQSSTYMISSTYCGYCKEGDKVYFFRMHIDDSREMTIKKQNTMLESMFCDYYNVSVDEDYDYDFSMAGEYNYSRTKSGNTWYYDYEKGELRIGNNTFVKCNISISDYIKNSMNEIVTDIGSFRIGEYNYNVDYTEVWYKSTLVQKYYSIGDYRYERIKDINNEYGTNLE